MSSPLPQAASYQANLALDGGAKLAGQLSVNTEGKLQLEKVKLLAGTSTGGKVSLRTGMQALLSVAENSECTDIPIRIDGVAKGTLSLSPRDPDAASSQRCLQLLTGKTPDYVSSGGAQLTGSSAEYSFILKTFHKDAISRLGQLFPEALDEMQSELLALSSRIKPDEHGRNRVYDATVALRRRKDDICNTVLTKIESYFQQLVPAEGEDEYWQQDIDSPDELGLVDLDEFEGHLALDRMVGLAEDLHKVALEALTVRVATLIGEDPYDVRLPIHARQLCRAFQQALEFVGVSAEASPVVFEYFSQHVIRQLDGYYQPLNEYLAGRDIRPDVEQQIRSQGSLLKRKTRRPKPPAAAKATPKPEEDSQYLSDVAANLRSQGIAPATPALATMDPAAITATMTARPVNLYQSVVDALNFRREVEGLADGSAVDAGTPMSGTWDGATVPSSQIDQQALADANTIAQALRSLQRSNDVRSAVQEASSLREYLAEHKEQLGDLRDTSGLTAESLNQLDLVDNLFGTIKSQVDVTNELKPALANLQIPLARLALLDQRFFLDKGHAARTVIDKLSGLATSANFPNRALEDRINKVVDDIVEDYENDSAVFDRALEQIDKLSKQQERALSRNIERVVRIQEGQEKLQQARRAVAAVINERIRPPAAPRVLLDLVESGWRDLMVLTHVKEGPESNSWSDHIKTLDQLAGWLVDKQSGELNDDMLMQLGLEAETLIDMVEQQITGAMPTNINHQDVLSELRDILAGNLAVDTAQIDPGAIAEPDDPEKVRAKVEDLPRLRRWVRRVEQLDKDSWLNYRDQDGKKRRMQLAWISPDKDRYIFVNERGQKIADLNAVQLARKLSRGAQPPAPADKLSVVDQSMYQTLEHVQKTLSFSRNHDSLTKLINRETFLDQMGRALRHAQLKNSQHAVLYLDIDQFKLVNEIYDQINGDAVLQEFSQLLAQLHGKKSSSARIESDQFAVLLLDRSLDQAEQLAEKVRQDIEAGSIELDGDKVSFTVSVGVAPIIEYSPSVDQVLESARTSMEIAKEKGRNRVQRYEEDQALASSFNSDKSRTRQDLEQALATDRFVLRAQPIIQVAVDGKQPVGRHYELLLGLSNPDGSLASPEEFIQSAERYGFMNLVDRWVVKEAFSWVSQLMDDEKEVPNLAINLSGSSVTDDDFMEYLLEQISEFGVGTSHICFEITETGTISNLVKAADFVRAFRNIGCKFSIDDFGTGLASHNYLRELPVDYVKIDGTFVTGIHKNRADYAMARSINDLAHFLGQETIAESVENDLIIAKLNEIGVDYLQGWGVGMPKLLTEVTADLSNLDK
jgi:diguanylate cyclase (GGDEF)-like protein